MRLVILWLIWLQASLLFAQATPTFVVSGKSRKEPAAPAELTLEKALELAMAHPELSAAAAETRAAEGQVRQAGYRPNPTLNLQAENWRFFGDPAFDASEDLDVFAYLSQTFETGGKRSRRIASALEDRRLADAARSVRAWQIRQEVRQAFVRALLSQGLESLARDNQRYFDQVVEYHRIQVEQGRLPEADLIKVQLESARLALDAETAALETERSRQILWQAIGLGGPAPAYRLADQPAAPSGAPVQDPAELQRRARTARAEMQLAQARMDIAQARLDLERTLAKPDWTVSFGYKRASGFNAFLAGVSVPLPFFDRNEGNIHRRSEELSGAQCQQHAQAVRVDGEVDAAWTALARRRSMQAQLRREVLDRARQSWDIALATYQEGGIDLLRLLDARRALADSQLLDLRLGMECRLGQLELEAAVGEENLNLATD